MMTSASMMWFLFAVIITTGRGVWVRPNVAENVVTDLHVTCTPQAGNVTDDQENVSLCNVKVPGGKWMAAKAVTWKGPGQNIRHANGLNELQGMPATVQALNYMLNMICKYCDTILPRLEAIRRYAQVTFAKFDMAAKYTKDTAIQMTIDAKQLMHTASRIQQVTEHHWAGHGPGSNPTVVTSGPSATQRRPQKNKRSVVKRGWSSVPGVALTASDLRQASGAGLSDLRGVPRLFAVRDIWRPVPRWVAVLSPGRSAQHREAAAQLEKKKREKKWDWRQRSGPAAPRGACAISGTRTPLSGRSGCAPQRGEHSTGAGGAGAPTKRKKKNI
ncbi:hypothetical protein NDU88_000661 [Pleurodeles waltl]|uniref:Uncharacterized protein n=1 Tax=Pleurodeles waltl TaxID=8319 RepID=A0AAV7THU5_PLEWA|nr:hypothetical protein NDU88_000661 [Pleurodeles waltl]